MHRSTLLILAALGLMGCNPHPLKEVEYEHWTGDTGMGTEEAGTEGGTGEMTETETDTGMDLDVGPECGNGVVEPGEQCDEGDANGDPPSTCGLECIWNIS